ncbi:MAG TPA: hypothetical protein VF101_20025 [Gaiellaceae bacterium]
MSTTELNKRRIVAVVATCVAIGTASGVGATAIFGSSHARSGISPGAVQRALADGKKVEVARFPSVPGLQDRSVFLAEADGLICLWDAVDAAHEGGGGCNDANDPFAGRKMMFGLSWDGGPALSSVSNGRLSGLVAPDVDRVYLELSDGSKRPIRLTNASPYRAFAYRISKADARPESQPVAVVAFDASGRQIDRQPTGFK